MVEEKIKMMIETLHVNFHEVVNMKPRPIDAVETFLKASERFVVAAFFIICVSSDSLLKSSPVLVTSKNAISYKKFKYFEESHVNFLILEFILLENIIEFEQTRVKGNYLVNKMAE